jgi:serine phosphatase RsbU (regulator of sigma subunit)
VKTLTHTETGPEILRRQIRQLSEKETVAHLNAGIWANRHVGSGQYADLAKECLLIAERIHLQLSSAELAQAYLNVGNTAWNRSQPELAIDALRKAANLFRSVEMTGKACFSEAILANLHNQKGQYNEAISLILQVLEEIRGSGEDEVEGLANLSAGSFHLDLESYTEALSYFNESNECFRRYGDDIGIARSMNNAGIVLHKLGRHEEALSHCKESLKIYDRLDLDQGKAKATRDIGEILESQEEWEGALSFYYRSLAIREAGFSSRSAGVDGVITCLLDLGNLLSQMNRLEEALENLHRALTISQEAGTTPKLLRIHQRLAEVYRKMNDFELAFRHLQSHTELKNELMGQESANLLKMLQARHAHTLAQRESEIEKMKNQELSEAYFKLNVVNRNITDSLNYAKRIQNSFLPSMHRFRQFFPDSFILNLPKDIVSGDFYWISQKAGKYIVVLADCSGHGVPGAFMSMAGMSLLNQIVNERGVTEPGKILNQINLALINQLRQVHEESISESMDVSVCVFENDFSRMEYAGARRPLYYLKDGRMQEFKPYTPSIGFDPYTNFEEGVLRLDLHNIQEIFLTTDGFHDQFGGEGCRKLMASKMKELFVEYAPLDAAEQEFELRNFYQEWKGKEPQTDDVLIIGIRNPSRNRRRQRP